MLHNQPAQAIAGIPDLATLTAIDTIAPVIAIAIRVVANILAADITSQDTVMDMTAIHGITTVAAVTTRVGIITTMGTNLCWIFCTS